MHHLRQIIQIIIVTQQEMVQTILSLRHLQVMTSSREALEFQMQRQTLFRFLVVQHQRHICEIPQWNVEMHQNSVIKILITRESCCKIKHLSF